MGYKTDKMNILKRYLVGTTGIPFISVQNMRLVGPHPYSFEVTTEANLSRWGEGIRKNNVEGKINIHIRWDKYISSIEDAWVGIRLQDFVKLIEAYEQTQKDRRQDAASN